MEDYFLINVNDMFKGASSAVGKTKQGYFHEFNRLDKVMQIINVRASKKDCGSAVSNWIAKNNAAK